MLAELVDRLVELGRKSAETAIVQVPGIPDAAWLVWPDGARAEVKIPPKDQHPKMSDLASFIDKVKGASGEPEVFVAEGNLYAHLDRDERRESVELPLRESSRFILCQKLQSAPRVMAPREAVKMLRLELASQDHHMVAALSKIDFLRKGSGKSVVGHGSESLGRTVEAIVQQADDIPTTFVVTVAIWTNGGLAPYAEQITFGIHLDPQAETVEIRALPDQVELARARALERLADEIREQLGGEIPVYIGKP